MTIRRVPARRALPRPLSRVDRLERGFWVVMLVVGLLMFNAWPPR
jgi:hypothetical protein